MVEPVVDPVADQPVSIFDDLRSEIEDPQFFKLKSIFLRKGKGRPKKLPVVSLNNKLLVQVLVLKEEGNKSYDAAATHLKQLCPDRDVSKLRYLLQSCGSNWTAAKAKQSIQDFLMTSFEQLPSLGSFLGTTEMSQVQLFGGHCLTTPASQSFGLLKDLSSVKKSSGKSYKDMSQWWFQLTGSSIKDNQLKNAVEKLNRKSTKLGSRGELYDQFLLSHPFESATATTLASHTPSEIVVPPTVQAAASDTAFLATKLATKGRELAAARRKAEEEQKTLKDVTVKLSTCEQVSVDALSQLNEVKRDHDILKTCCMNLEAKATADDSEIQDLRRRLNYYQKQGLQKKLCRQKREIKRLKGELQQMTSLASSRKREKAEKKLKVRELQLKNASLKRSVRLLKKQLEKPAPETEPLLPMDYNSVCLKNERGFFTKEAVLLVMTLVGEMEVAANRCGGVIEAVARLLFNTTIPPADLPSQRSALRFADQGHVLSKVHVAETLLEGQHWDLHTDGTTKGGAKFVGQQVNVDGQVMSTGFSTVPTENTVTLVERTFNMLQELCAVYEKEEAHQHFLFMLQTLTGGMTDRAEVMKSFMRRLNEERREMLQLGDNERSLHFLNCNAHFLLGLSGECEKALFQAEKDGGEKLGRDRLPLFRSYQYSTESSASRYIRLSCDCLGPRGDDKNGCRDLWKTFCSMTNKASLITSFKNNRFNNFFSCAGILHFHREDIKQCLSVYIEKRNKKLQSILEDATCDTIACHLVAISILYYRLTGPYWELIQSSCHYLDFFTHVVAMHSFLQRWAERPADAFAQPQDFDPLFGEKFMPQPFVYEALMEINDEMKDTVRELLQKICSGLVVVTERQLRDFLPGGRYHCVEDPAQRDELQNSKLTNLLGEQAFGDLDFSLFKRRNATLFHHSTIQMLKRNGTTEWLLQKSVDTRDLLLESAAKQAPGLRKKHKAEEEEAVLARSQILDDNRQRKEAAEERKRTKIQQVMDLLPPHNGPCKTPEDVNVMLTKYPTKKDQLLAVKAELLFQKLVLLKQSPLLRVTGSLQLLSTNLKVLFGADPDVAAAEFLTQPTKKKKVPAAESRQKRRIVASESSGSDEEDTILSEEEEEQDNTDLEEFVFTYTEEGQLCAVYYDSDFYIGEVVKVLSADKGDINFMSRCTVKSNTFCWPRKEDRDTVDRWFVFSTDIRLQQASKTRGTWTVSNLSEIEAQFRLYSTLFI